MSERRTAAFRLSTMVALALGALTVLEYFAAALNSAVIMFIIAIIKGWAVLHYFMHISRLWTEEGEH